MSDDERYQIIGRMVSDHEEAKKRLATLEVKAKGIGDFIQAVSNVLTGTAKSFMFDPGRTITIGPYNQARGGSGQWPTIDELRELMQEIESTRQDIRELERRRKELGV